MRISYSVLLFPFVMLACAGAKDQPGAIVQKLAFMSTRDGNFDVYLMDSNGENVENLTNHPATDYAFAWSPTGDKILFYTDRDGNNEIYVMDVDTRSVINLTNHPASDRLHAWSAGGDKIAFSSDRDHRDGELYLMNADGSGVTRITNNEVYEDALCFGPDGRIYFTRMTSGNEDGDGEIFSINVDGSGEHRLTFRDGFDAGVAWSPDAKKIAFYGPDSTDNYEIFVMDPDGGNIAAISLDTLEDYSPSWSADGEWIAYTSGNKSNYDVWLINLGTREKKRLTTHPKRDESPLWRPVQD